MEIISTALLLILFSYLLYISTRRPKNFPPGLRRIPIIGQTLKGSRPLMWLWRRYKIIGHFIGNTPAVTIQDFQLAKELLSREEWCGRGQSIIERYLRSDTGVCKGIITADGQRWLEHRRFTIRHLKEFGFGRIGLESVIQEEAEELVKYLASRKDQDIRLSTQFGVPVINVLWTIVAGSRFHLEDPQVMRMMNLLNRLFKEKFVVEYMFPVWGLICYLVPGLNTRRRIITELRAMFRETIRQHRQTIDVNDPRDFVDVYLAEIISETNSHFDLESLEITCLDLFKAGAETTSTTILWVVLYLVRYQDVQEKCYQEIMRETGEARPSLSHNLPFCQAVIWEVQRLACVAPQTIPHRLTETAVVGEYLIPKNSHALANLWGFMKDPSVWVEPEEFKPERFLQGDKLIKHPQFVPFGLGRRACMGEKLARDNLFIFITTLIKNLRLEAPTEHARPDPSNFTDGFTIIPHPFYVRIKRRNVEN